MESASQDHCPRCGAILSLRQIIQLMNGSGFVRHIRIRLPDGGMAVLEARDVNPNTMEIVEDVEPRAEATLS